MFQYFWGQKLGKDEAAQQAVTEMVESIVDIMIDEGVVTPIVDVVVISEAFTPKGHAVTFNPLPNIEGVVEGCLSPPTAKPYRVVLHEGSMRDGREASIQFWDDDFSFRVITKKHVLLFRSPCLNELIAYKKQHMRF